VLLASAEDIGEELRLDEEENEGTAEICDEEEAAG